MARNACVKYLLTTTENNEKYFYNNISFRIRLKETYASYNFIIPFIVQFLKYEKIK